MHVGMHDQGRCSKCMTSMQPVAGLQVDRRKLAADWRKRLQAVQASALAASQEGLSGELQAQLLAGSSDSTSGSTYLAALQLRDELAASAEKTLLGYYKGEAGIVDKIVKAFEKGCEWCCLPCRRNCIPCKYAWSKGCSAVSCGA